MRNHIIITKKTDIDVELDSSCLTIMQTTREFEVEFTLERSDIANLLPSDKECLRRWLKED